eukprot:1578446-Prymnesium_polylepis.1
MLLATRGGQLQHSRGRTREQLERESTRGDGEVAAARLEPPHDLRLARIRSDLRVPPPFAPPRFAPPPFAPPPFAPPRFAPPRFAPPATVRAATVRAAT